MPFFGEDQLCQRTACLFLSTTMGTQISALLISVLGKTHSTPCCILTQQSQKSQKVWHFWMLDLTFNTSVRLVFASALNNFLTDITCFSLKKSLPLQAICLVFSPLKRCCWVTRAAIKALVTQHGPEVIRNMQEGESFYMLQTICSAKWQE